MCVSNPIDIFKPHKWFKTPKLQVPIITIEQPKATPVAPPLAPLKPPSKIKAADAETSGIEQFSSRLTPTLQDILGLASPKIPPGLLIPGVKR